MIGWGAYHGRAVLTAAAAVRLCVDEDYREDKGWFSFSVDVWV
jgi:hypothetical protein